jgi:hypothetical protein
MPTQLKVYVVYLEEYDEEGSGLIDCCEVVYVTMSASEKQNIEKLWDEVQGHRHASNCMSTQALDELKQKYGIITWSGAELRIAEKELHGYKK